MPPILISVSVMPVDALSAAIVDVAITSVDAATSAGFTQLNRTCRIEKHSLLMCATDRRPMHDVSNPSLRSRAVRTGDAACHMRATSFADPHGPTLSSYQPIE